MIATASMTSPGQPPSAASKADVRGVAIGALVSILIWALIAALLLRG